MSEDVFHSVSMIMNVDPEEIAKIVHDYINRGIVSDYDRLNCPKPPIYIGPVKIKTLKERLEEMKMKATSVQNIKNVKDICFSIENHPAELESKLIIVASTNDDIFAFEFEGGDLLQQYKAAGLFSGWEKDQKIRELEKELDRWKKEAADCLKLRDEAQKEAYKLKKENEKYEEKIKKLEHDDMLDKNAVENEKLKEKLENVEPFIALERTIKEKQLLQKENKDLKKRYDRLNKKFNRVMNDNLPETLITDMIVDDYNRLVEENKKLREDKEYAENLNKELIDRWQKRYGDIREENKLLKKELAFEKAANEAQHKFIREYAGKGTQVQFNYAIDDAEEVSYVIVDKKTYDEKPNINLHGKDFTPDELVDRVLELEKKNLDLQKAYDILDKALDGSQKACNKWYEKWVKMLSEQDCHTKLQEEKIADNVNHPSHYTGKYECIDVMQDVFGDEATDNFCLCNAFKYIWRANKKNGIEDVKKAVWYLNKYIEEAEKDGVPKGK